MTLTLGPRSHKMLLSTIHIMWPMHLRTLKLLCPMVQEKMHFQVNTLFDRDPGHMKCCLVPSTSCYLCTGKIWSCYFQKFMRRCVYKKIHYLTLTLGSRSHEVLPSTLDIMWPMHRQNLKFLLPKVYEEMHLQENTIFHTKWHPVPSSSCDLCILLHPTVWEKIQFQEMWRTTDQLWYEINIPFFSNEKAGIKTKQHFLISYAVKAIWPQEY